MSRRPGGLKALGFAARDPPAIASFPVIAVLAAIGLATGAATLFGGAIALRFRDQIPLILGLSAGAVIGVALFDLIPEALELTRPSFPTLVTVGATGAGFCSYMLLHRALGAVRPGGAGGHLAPAILTAHSLVDGLGVGFAFQVAPAIGIVTAAAVLAHDVADGVNTVTLSLSGGGGARRARGWLIADAAAPLIGIAATRLFRLNSETLGFAIAVFGGFFLFIGASELAPASHRARPTLATSLATAAGMAAIWLAVRLA